jgi:hypothetical protein
MGEIFMQNKSNVPVRFSDAELMAMYRAVLRRALDNLTPEEIEENERFYRSVKLTGFEHLGAWKRKGR